MKNLLKVLFLFCLAGYLVFAFTGLSGGGDTTKCDSLNVHINDSIHDGFITEAEVGRIIRQAGLWPVGQEMKNIEGQKIERLLKKNPFIRTAKCWKTSGGTVNVSVSQRLPIMRIKANSGEDYYIDADGQPMDAMHYTADLVIATGQVSKQQAKDNLIHLGKYIFNNSFANDLVVQVNVDERGAVSLVPRFGCDVIRLGKTDSTEYAAKMERLQTFYTKVLPTTGWNKYSEIDLSYKGQVVARKKK